MAVEQLGADFSTTVEALLRFMPVLQLASELQSCSPGDDLAGVLAAPRWLGFDTLGVRTDGKVRHFLPKRAATPPGLVSGAMRLIPPCQFLAPGAPMTAAIRLLVEHEAVFVGAPSAATHIITRSDLLRLPVRLLCFAFVAQLEMVLTEAIRAKCPSDQTWRGKLSGGALKTLAKRQEKLQAHRMDPPPLDLLGFHEKYDLVASLCKMPGPFRLDMDRLRELFRNPVAHVWDFLGGEKDVRRLLENIQAAFRWSQILRKGYHPLGGGFDDLQEIGKALFGNGFEKERQSWDGVAGQVDWSAK